MTETLGETQPRPRIENGDPRTLGPQRDERRYFIAYGPFAAPSTPHAPWDSNDEDAYNIETERFDLRKVVTECPACGRQQSPLCSPYCRLLESGWRWVGIDHKEPYSTFVTRCRCKTVFRFTTHTPQ